MTKAERIARMEYLHNRFMTTPNFEQREAYAERLEWNWQKHLDEMEEELQRDARRDIELHLDSGRSDFPNHNRA